jgi:hypothetical protein
VRGGLSWLSATASVCARLAKLSVIAALSDRATGQGGYRVAVARCR